MKLVSGQFDQILASLSEPISGLSEQLLGVLSRGVDMWADLSRYMLFRDRFSSQCLCPLSRLLCAVLRNSSVFHLSTCGF